jgi:hypothetical protein
MICALFAWFISHQPVVLFAHTKSATSNQPAVLFSQNKPAPAIRHQPNEQAVAYELHTRADFVLFFFSKKNRRKRRIERREQMRELWNRMPPTFARFHLQASRGRRGKTARRNAGGQEPSRRVCVCVVGYSVFFGGQRRRWV